MDVANADAPLLLCTVDFCAVVYLHFLRRGLPPSRDSGGAKINPGFFRANMSRRRHMGLKYINWCVYIGNAENGNCGGKLHIGAAINRKVSYGVTQCQ